MAAANDMITITVVDLAHGPHEVSISQNATIKDLQIKILELKIVEAPSEFNLRLWKPSNNGITAIIFDKLDRTLDMYGINNDATIHVLMDPEQRYHNLNFPPVLTLSRMRGYHPGRNPAHGGKRTRRNRKSRRNHKSHRNKKTHRNRK